MNQDASRLEQSQSQLTKDKQTLADTQRQSTQASQAAPVAAPAVELGSALNNAIERPSRAEQSLPASLTAARPQLNSLGQTIGKLINVVA